MIEIVEDNFNEAFANRNFDNSFTNSVGLSHKVISRVDCRRLLIIGKVQSGKTSHFIGLVCKLFDSNYKMGIIFSGTKINLHNQTLKRFRRDLHNTKIKIISDNDKDLVSVYGNAVNNNIPIILICLKHHIRIDNLRIFLSGQSAVSNTFIIDDESDQASLNNHNLKNLFCEFPQLSSTHRAISKLEYLINPKYIQVTATPAAHLLTDDLDYFKPDYVFFLKPHENYFGNELLFANQSKLITIINEDPLRPNKFNLARFFAHYLKNAVDIDKSHVVDNISCFIHPHSDIPIINNYGSTISSIIEEFKNDLNSTIIKYSLEQYDLLSMHAEVNTILKHFCVQIVAGEEDEDVNFDDFFKKYKYFCLIGGGKLERGFTIEGLVTSYIPRSSKVGNGDTIQQRARFFGSKKNLLPNIHVFMNDKTYNDFKEYHTNEMYLFKDNLDFIKTAELKINFINDFTNPCRQNVLKSIKHAIGNSWQHYFFNVERHTNLYTLFGDQIDLFSHEILQSHTQKILRISTSLLLSSLKKLQAIEYKEISTSIDRIEYIINLLEDETIDIVLLGNWDGVFRERSSIIRNGKYLPSAVHQSYSNTSSYVGDANILLNYQPVTPQFSLIHLKETSIYYLATSFKINNL